MCAKSIVAVIGLGNGFRRDDGAGIEIAEKIRSKRLTDVRVFDSIADNAALIESWENCDVVFIVDAVSSGSSPGKIHRFEPLIEEIPADIFRNYSTHSLNLKQAVELAEILGKLPSSLIVYGIEGENYSNGAGLSPEVNKAASKVSEMIIKEFGEQTENRIRT